MMSLEGQQLGRYRILRLLGSGGMGEVYLAEDARIEQQVAIKVMRAEISPYPDAQASQEAARLFQCEAKAIVKLDHPHILPLYDYGEQGIGKMTVIYLVMPYRQEGSLLDWLRQRGPLGLLSPLEVTHVVGQAASALQHAHDHQVIHQDVKPSNFLLRHRSETPTRPDLLLADFGIATSSMSHTIRGTPTYMAPEQWEGQPVPATDQYALAVMAYELLTGHPPFQGGERQVMYQHLMVPPTPSSTVNPHLSRDMDTVLLHALAKKPDVRFASITAFAHAFQQVAQAMQAADAPPSRAPTPTPASQEDLRAALAISTAEAQAGTTRTLTLPGGRQVRISVPAGVHDGQIVRLEGQGDVPAAGGPPGALVLTLLVKAAEEPPSLSTTSAPLVEDTVLTANPETLVTDTPIVSNTSQHLRVSHAARPEMSAPASPAVSRGEAATPVNHETSASTDRAPAAKPSVGRPDTMSEVAQAEQRGVIAPMKQPALLPVMGIVQLVQRGISRRTVVVGLAGLTIVGVAGGGLVWLRLSSPPIGTSLYTYSGHSQDVTAVAWSPDGKRIVSGSGDTTVQVWDAVDGGNVYTYKGHANIVTAVAWSPDGKRIASGSDDTTVQVWDAANGGNVYSYSGHSNSVNAVIVNAVAWSPDGKRIASGSGDTTVQVWDAANGGNVYTYHGHSQDVNAVAWSPDGKRIASGSTDKTVQVEAAG